MSVVTARTFTPRTLEALDELILSRAHAVISMREIVSGNTRPDVIGMRHDVDANGDGRSLQTAVRLAEWEAERGYRSSYYLLHTAPYWGREGFADAVDRIARLGHEIGIHTNAIAEALRVGADPDALLGEALARLRSLGHAVTGVVAHGDRLCGIAHFVNDEQFEESARPGYGPPDRIVAYDGAMLELRPRPLAIFGLRYLPNWLSRALYLSDSGGEWNTPLEDVAAGFPFEKGQVHILQHPDWWEDAL